ncbi:phosphate signaling complex protein PhoU [Microaceticoccus formicicus]|uniref:phosphate signaling complex protein PhoU n=1 Tax=Microaceticoccus formicicus TaxID=3118105 RepID=UPI003CD04FAD|nr:phosphate signaling complex protein PhoU [Peptoniphilaceae bacterium AMB_02]
MRVIYEKQLNKLKIELNEMGRYITQSIEDSMKALKTRDMELAKTVKENESEIIELERQIETRCVKLIMKQQPVAGDLRFISQAMKMINYMGRIGRQSADIAEIIILMVNGKDIPTLTNLDRMSEITVKNVLDAVCSYTNSDADLVKSVIINEDKIDKCFDMVKTEIIEKLRSGEDNSAILIDLLMISKYLERIGDHAERIAIGLSYSIAIEE